MNVDSEEVLNRWRLILGREASKEIEFSGEENYLEMEEVLEYLYSREHEDHEQSGGQGKSILSIPKWINDIQKLFPKETVEIMEKHALERYHMTELITDKNVLERLEPNRELLGLIMSMKNFMNNDVLDTAKGIVKKVADEISDKIKKEMSASISGKLLRMSSSPIKSSRNLDIKKTIQRNLKNYDTEMQKLIVDKVYFYSRMRRYCDYQVIICVDESGSMLSSVIYSAVMAGIFYELPAIDTKLVIFDTEVVDLSDIAGDVVDTLMKVQLGGGTYISKALSYCETLIKNPNKTIVVLVTDLFEGGNMKNLYATAKGIIESQAKLLVLTALDMEANPVYNRKAAQVLSDMGAEVGAMTPLQLADFVAERMG